MKKKEIKLDRLNKIICIRLSNEDYNSLLKLSEYKQSNIAHIGKRRIMSRFKHSFQREQ